MDNAKLEALKQWFTGYCGSFYSTDPADQKNIAIKENHTYQVSGNMVEIGRDLGLEEGRLALAEAIGLFHDVGRFPQYRKYRTFRDNISANHAALGASVLNENNVLRDLAERERKIVLQAVTLHNVFSLPLNLDEEEGLFLKMIRDADKLDIWRVFIDYYAQQDEDRASAVALGLPDTPGYSAEVLASVLRREMVHLSMLRTLNDFKLLQLAWIFDLNFVRSLQLILEQSIIEKIAGTLPDTAEIKEAVDFIRNYVDTKVCVQ